MGGRDRSGPTTSAPAASDSSFRAACSPRTARSSSQRFRPGRDTRFVRYDTRTGRGRRIRTAPGFWNVVGISADGRRIARFKFRKGARATIFTLDDPERSGTVRLPGTFQLDSLSQDGRRLFLVHWNHTGRYDLQQYDRANRTLGPDSARRAGREDDRPSNQRSRDAGRPLAAHPLRQEQPAHVHPCARSADRRSALHRPAAAGRPHDCWGTRACRPTRPRCT